MRIPDFDLLGTQPFVLRGMVVTGMYNLRMVTVTLQPENDNPDSLVFVNTTTQEVYPENQAAHSLYFEVARADWFKLIRVIHVLRQLYTWFKEDVIEERLLFPVLYDLACSELRNIKDFR